MEHAAQQGTAHYSQMKPELAQLKKQLLELNQQKEESFNIQKNCQKQAYELIAQWKDIKKELDASASLKSKLQQQRDMLNKKVKEMIQQAKENNVSRKKIFEKNEVRINPRAIKEKIEQLDTKIETEALEFDTEKKLMKHIKELKKKIHDAEEVKSVLKEHTALSREITAARQEANHFHQQLYQKREEDNKKYQQLKELSKKIRILKKEQQGAFDEFITRKKAFIEKNEQLKGKLTELTTAVKEQRHTKQQYHQHRQQREAERMAQLEQAVEEKLRTKKKLTTEDLLVFQRK